MDKCIVSISDETHSSAPFVPYLSKGQLFAKNLKLYEPSVLGGKVDVISSKMKIVIDGNPTPDDFIFVPFHAEFKSKKKPQILIIDTTTLQQVKGISIAGLKFETAHAVHIEGIYVDDGSGIWSEVGHTQALEGQINNLMFLFKMPTNLKTEKFKFFLRIQTELRAAPFDCDPQVGNDPPQ